MNKLLKVLTNIEKWIFLVILSYTVIFTFSIKAEYGGRLNSIEVEKFASSLENMNTEELEQLAIGYEKRIEDFKNGSINEEDTNYLKTLKKYPVGTYTFTGELARMSVVSDLDIQSIIMALIVGSIIYLILDEKERRALIYVLIYILFVFLSGFIEGMTNRTIITTFWDIWAFPKWGMLTVTILFGIMLCIIKVRQQGTIRKLNESLMEKKKEKSEIVNNDNQTILQRTKEARENIARVILVISKLMIIIIGIIVLLFF